MAVVTVELENFPGLAIQYDPTSTPWFEIGVKEALNKIKSVDLGVQLLKLIADAKPAHRVGQDGVTFPPDINVIISPQANRGFTQSGYKMDYGPGSAVKNIMVKSTDPRLNVAGHSFNFSGGGSFNCNQDPRGQGAIAHSRDGTGCVCKLEFDSSQIMTRGGFHTTSFINLAHELIHSYHGLYGIHAGANEEKWTTGIGEFKDEPMSENGFRDKFGMDERTSY